MPLKKTLETEGIINTGDVMYDCVKIFSSFASQQSNIQHDLNLKKKNYVLATIHRAENTNSEIRLRRIIEGLEKIATKQPVILPLHPRTRKILEKYTISLNHVTVIPPVNYIDMLSLSTNAFKIITDSGGLQKEAFWLGVPCITARDETEWVETIEQGWNTLIGANYEKMIGAYEKALPIYQDVNIYGSGDASSQIVEHIENFFKA